MARKLKLKENPGSKDQEPAKQNIVQLEVQESSFVQTDEQIGSK